MTLSESKSWLWAIPAGSNDRIDEYPLTSTALTASQVEQVKIAASKDGWHSFRTVKEDFEVPNFAAAAFGTSSSDSSPAVKSKSRSGAKSPKRRTPKEPSITADDILRAAFSQRKK